MRYILIALCLVGRLSGSAQDDQRRIKVPVIFHVFYTDARPDNGFGPAVWEDGNSTQNLPLAKLLAELKDVHDDFLFLNSDSADVHPAFKRLIGNPTIELFLADTILQRGGEKGIVRIKSKTNKKHASIKSRIVDPSRFLNVYIGNFGGSSVPSATPWDHEADDALFLDYRWVGLHYRLMTHEAGHWFGLLHIYGGSGGAKGDDCKGDGDEIKDTPPQRNATDIPCQKCPPDVEQQQCSAGLTNYNNYMDYSGCRKMFTRDQKDAMRANVRLHRERIWNASAER